MWSRLQATDEDDLVGANFNGLVLSGHCCIVYELKVSNYNVGIRKREMNTKASGV